MLSLKLRRKAMRIISFRLTLLDVIFHSIPKLKALSAEITWKMGSVLTVISVSLLMDPNNYESIWILTNLTRLKFATASWLGANVVTEADATSCTWFKTNKIDKSNNKDGVRSTWTKDRYLWSQEFQGTVDCLRYYKRTKFEEKLM